MSDEHAGYGPQPPDHWVPPEAIENGAEPDDALNPHAVSEIPEARGAPEDALDVAYGAAEARQALAVHHGGKDLEADYEAGS